jgi:long-chain acyl-CoA synthetase
MRVTYNILTTHQGLTTAAQKLNRKGILKQYQKEVDQAYGKSS